MRRSRRCTRTPTTPSPRPRWRATSSDLGYALLLKRYDPNVVDATDAEIAQAAQDTVPDGRRPCFGASASWSGWASASSRCSPPRSGSPLGAGSIQAPLVPLAFGALPALPWISCELGWIVAEYGRQPWAIEAFADLPCQLFGHGGRRLVLAERLHRLLHHVGHRRSLSHRANHSSGTGDGRRRSRS